MKKGVALLTKFTKVLGYTAVFKCCFFDQFLINHEKKNSAICMNFSVIRSFMNPTLAGTG